MDPSPKTVLPRTFGIERLLSDGPLCERMLAVHDDLRKVLDEAQRAIVTINSPDTAGHAVFGIRAADELVELLASKGAHNKKQRQPKETES